MLNYSLAHCLECYSNRISYFNTLLVKANAHACIANKEGLKCLNRFIQM